MKEKITEEGTNLRQLNKEQNKEMAKWCLNKAKHYQYKTRQSQDLAEDCQKEAEWWQSEAKRYQEKASE